MSAPVDNLVLQVSNKVAPTDEDKVSEVRARLALAGLTHSSAVGQYYLARLVSVILPQVGLLFALPYLGNFAPTIPLFASVALLIVGFVGPSFYVDHLISARQKPVFTRLPRHDGLDGGLRGSGTEP